MTAESVTLAGKEAVPVETLRRAMAANAAGRLDEAEFYCRLVLAANKKQFDAVHLLGLIKFQRGNLDEAHRLIRQAIKLNPKSAKARSNLALVLQQLGRPEQALASLDGALAIEPDNLLALNNRGHILWQLKRPDEALESLDQALAIKPDYGDALCNRGNALADLRRLEEALVSYDQALSINPHDAPTLNNRGNVLWALERHEEALRSYDRALAVSPNDLSTLKDRGAALLTLKRGEDALECFDRALAIKPGDPYLVFKRGSALIIENRYEEALACFDEAFAAAGGDADALDDRGSILAALQRHAEALASYDQALAIAPDSAKAHWNRSLTLLRIGDFDQGWNEYEWRWRVNASWVRVHDFPQHLLWLGEQPIEGKTIVLHAEQGFGDTIQFARYVPMVAARGAKVIVEVQPELKTVVSRVKGADQVIGKGEELPAFDCHCPLLSLPLAFKTQLETIPANTPYLSAAKERVALWSSRLPKSDLPRVGVAWGGNLEFVDDKTRSIGLAPLAPLLSTPGFQFVSIQKDLRAGDEQFLQNNPQVLHLGDQIVDFEDTAAIMSLLDLIISSDTAPVHLAGALGRPVWVLLQRTPDWRWMLEREDNPWYPSARLFRQVTAGDWDGLVKKAIVGLNSARAAIRS
jgi:tetratricopeptide (TPR) repeat protein